MKTQTSGNHEDYNRRRDYPDFPGNLFSRNNSITLQNVATFALWLIFKSD
jgi:hypothetical protein